MGWPKKLAELTGFGIEGLQSKGPEPKTIRTQKNWFREQPGVSVNQDGIGRTLGFRNLSAAVSLVLREEKPRS
jgi:hypothetical protein